jgi:hypothetical protein
MQQRFTVVGWTVPGMEQQVTDEEVAELAALKAIVAPGDLIQRAGPIQVGDKRPAPLGN